MSAAGYSGGQEYEMYDYGGRVQPVQIPAFNEDGFYYDPEEGFEYRHRRTSVHRNVNVRNPQRTHDRRTSWIDTAATFSHHPLDEHAEHIVAKIGEDVELTADTQQAEQMRREALRDMPQSLTMKRLVKQKLLTNLSQRTKTHSVGFFKRNLYSFSIFVSKLKSSSRNFFYSFQLWYGSLKKIEGEFGSAVATFFRFFRWLFVLNVFTFLPCLIFVVLPQALQGDNDQLSSDPGFSGADIFTGDGSFTNSLLFYGHYTNETFSVTRLSYVMPHAYFYTMVCLYAANFIVLSMSTSKSYRKNFIQTKGGLKNIFAHKVFAGWDYGIATCNAAQLKSTAIYNELRELMQELTTIEPEESCCDKFKTFMIRFILNLIIVVTLGATGYGMWLLLDVNRKNASDSSYGVVTAVVINSIMFVVPFFFTAVIRYEAYDNPRTGFYVTLIRTFLLELVVIGTSVAYWVMHSTAEVCWETSLGQEMYRLIIFDFLFSIIFHTMTEIVRKLISMKWNIMSAPEFDIARYALQLVYNQTLFWVGMYFSPMMAIVIVIKLLLTWYMITEIVLRVCNPSSRSWRAAHTHTGFLIMSFTSLILVIVTLGYIITSVKTSNCGPFGHLAYVSEIIKAGILNLREGALFWKIVIYFTKPGAIALLLLLMCLVIYYLRAKAKAQDGMVRLLREMHVSEARDKEYLLKRISHFTKGRWQFNIHDNMAEPDITSPSAYSYINRKYNQYGDFNIGGNSSEILLPSTSGSTMPAEEVGLDTVFQRFKKYE